VGARQVWMIEAMTIIVSITKRLIRWTALARIGLRNFSVGCVAPNRAITTISPVRTCFAMRKRLHGASPDQQRRTSSYDFWLGNEARPVRGFLRILAALWINEVVSALRFHLGKDGFHHFLLLRFAEFYPQEFLRVLCHFVDIAPYQRPCF
jgi:hypothetical protein